MTVQATEMAKAVRVAIDMNKDDEPLFVEGDTDTLTLDERSEEHTSELQSQR